MTPPAPWVPRRQELPSLDRGHGPWGHLERRWEASPDDLDRVAAWAEAELRRRAPAGAVVETTGRRSWEHRRETVRGTEIRGVAVHLPTSKKLHRSLAPELPEGTRCLLAWTTGFLERWPESSSDILPPTPPIVAPPLPPRRRFWRRGR